MFLSSSPTTGFERLRWYESTALHTRLFALVGAISLITVLGYGWRAFRRAPIEARLPRTNVLLGWLYGVGAIALLAGVAYGLGSNTEEFNYGIPAFVVAMMWVAKVMVVLGVAIVGLAVWQIVNGSGSVGARHRYAAIAVMAIVFTWQIFFWNMV
jgi:hypothetical protein